MSEIQSVYNDQEQIYKKFVNKIFENAQIKTGEPVMNFITVYESPELKGLSFKIRNITFNLREIVMFAFELSEQLTTDSKLLFIMKLFVETVCEIFGRAKKYLTDKECQVILAIQQEKNNGHIVCESELLKKMVNSQVMTEIEFRNVIKKLLHLRCIEILEEKIFIVEKLKIKSNY